MGGPGQPPHQGMVGVYSGQQMPQQQLRPQHPMMHNMGQPMNQMQGGPMGKPNAMVQQHIMQTPNQQQQQQPNRSLPGMEQVWKG